MRRVYLRSCEPDLCPDIPVSGSKPVSVGRGPATGIRDPRVSRDHLTLTLQEEREEERVVVTQKGPNHSVVDGKPVVSGVSAHMRAGSSLSLLSDKYHFKLIVSPEDGSQPERGKNDQTVSRDSEERSRKSHWSEGLLSAMKDPEYVVYSTAQLVIIRDKYPKSKHHFLVIPNKPIHRIENLRPADVHLLEDMNEEASNFVCGKFPEWEFQFGYHAVPSMAQLHLHALTKDFHSDCLKHKKHWNSFNTDFFLSPRSVIRQLREDGKVRTPTPEEAKALLATPLKCNQCPYFPKNIPDLKRHLKVHYEER